MVRYLMFSIFSATKLLTRSRFFLLFLLFSIFSVGCAASKPIRDYSMARQALVSAKKSQALKHSAEKFHQSELAYQKAEVAFKEGDYAKAQALFSEARILAEEAENQARLKSFQSGEFGP